MKQRNRNKPFFITISSIDFISDVAIYDERMQAYIDLYPQKVFTFILKKSNKLPKYVNPEFTTVGVQIAS
jgi:tRNA A37 threonylcarbamoyladenosine synthetase subunit TsaC/SUA5/YrdC